MYTMEDGKTDQEIEQAIKRILAQGGQMFYTWNCGGDEAIVTISGDEMAKAVLAKDDALNDSIEIYILNLLCLPDAGEFAMDGQGSFTVADGEVRFKYESRMKGYAGYDEETYESTGWIAMDEIEPGFTGVKKLFR